MLSFELKAGVSPESDMASSATSVLSVDVLALDTCMVSDESSCGPSVVGVDVEAKVEIDRKLELMSFWICKMEAPGVIGEPRLAAGPNLSLEGRGGVFVGVEVADEDRAVGGGNVMTSKFVINIAGHSSSSFVKIPQSCPTMWISDPGCGCLMVPKRGPASKKHRRVKSTVFIPCTSDLAFPKEASKLYDVQVRSKDLAPE